MSVNGGDAGGGGVGRAINSQQFGPNGVSLARSLQICKVF